MKSVPAFFSNILRLINIQALGLEPREGSKGDLGVCRCVTAGYAGLVDEEWPPNMTRGHVFLRGPRCRGPRYLFLVNCIILGCIELYALQIILDLCVPEKELAKTRSQI